MYRNFSIIPIRLVYRTLAGILACSVSTAAVAETVRTKVEGRVFSQQVITRTASKLGIDSNDVSVTNLARGVLTKEDIASIPPGDPVALVKTRVLRPKSRSNIQHRPSFGKGGSGVSVRTVYAACLGINEWVGHTYCSYPYPWGLTLVAYGRNLFNQSDTIYHRFSCEMSSSGYVNYSNPYDGWDGSSYCPYGATVSSIDNGFDYLGYVRFPSYGRTTAQADSLRWATHSRYGVSDSCQGPSYPGQSHGCGSSIYDLVWAAPYPTFNPPRSNSDCWFKRYLGQFTYGVFPPVVSPCWIG